MCVIRFGKIKLVNGRWQRKEIFYFIKRTREKRRRIIRIVFRKGENSEIQFSKYSISSIASRKISCKLPVQFRIQLSLDPTGFHSVLFRRIIHIRLFRIIGRKYVISGIDIFRPMTAEREINNCARASLHEGNGFAGNHAKLCNSLCEFSTRREQATEEVSDFNARDSPNVFTNQFTEIGEQINFCALVSYANFLWKSSFHERYLSRNRIEIFETNWFYWVFKNSFLMFLN